jgi:hypothetical protein
MKKIIFIILLTSAMLAHGQGNTTTQSTGGNTGGGGGVVRYNMITNSYTVSSGINKIALTQSITSTYTITLLPSSNYLGGSSILIIDEFGSINSTNKILIKSSNGDLINGLPVLEVNSSYAIIKLWCDGISKWTTMSTVNYSEGIYIPSWTGYSLSPTSITAECTLVGNQCTVHLFCAGLGTSNSGNKTVTLPFVAKNSSDSYISCVTYDASTSPPINIGLVKITANSSIASCYKNAAQDAWTNGALSSIGFTLTYLIK